MIPVLLALGAAAAAYYATRGTAPSVFISFAADDARIRDLLIGQSKHPDVTWKMRDRSLHEPFDNAWRTKTKEIIAQSDALIALVGKDTHRAEGAIWEIKTALTLGVPVFGVHISKDDKGTVPACLKGNPVIVWSREGIARELEKALKRNQ